MDKEVSGQRLWTKNFVLVSLANLFLFIGFQMLLPVLPVYSVKLGGASTSAGLVIGVFTFSSVVMRPVAGLLLDQKGRKGIFFYGLMVIMICTLAYQWVPGVLSLLALRFIHGFGWGAAGTATGTIASDLIPKKRFAEGIGYFALTGTAAMAIAPAVGLALMHGYGFRTVFNVSVAAVIAAFVIAVPIKLQKTKPQAAGESKGLIEKSAVIPSLVMLFITMSYGAIVSFIALYAQERQVQNIGLFFTIYAIALLVSRPFFGRIADRKGHVFAVMPGILGILGAMAILYFAHALSVFLIAGFIYGLGFGAAQPALQAMAVRNVAAERRGTANATFFLGFDLGIGLGSIVWGMVAEAAGYRPVYVWAMVPVVAAMALYLRNRKADSVKQKR